ncbi:MAG: cytochrome c biogenesis protein [Candidatus Woesearchaeota archaeon]
MNKKLPLAMFLAFVILSVFTLSDDSTCSVTKCATIDNVSVSFPATESSAGEICIYFFYGKNCPHCARVEPLVTELAVKHPRVDLKPFEIYFNNSNQQLFNDFVSRYDIDTPGVPALFIGDRALIGEAAIRDNLETSIAYFEEHGPICPETYKKVEGTPHELSPATDVKLTLPALVIAAVIDSINPCAFSVLIFLLLYLSALGARKKMLKVGITYIVVIFIVYFLSGLGLFTVIQTTNLTKFVYTIAAVIAIIAGLINVKDFFWYGKGITLAIPESRKPLLQKYIHKATLPAAVVLGVLVSMFELPCTGGVYLAVLGLLSSKMTLIQGIPYLLLYNLIFVLPLFVILLAIFWGMPPERAERWRLDQRKWMKLAMGILMITLGVIMLLGWI